MLYHSYNERYKKEEEEEDTYLKGRMRRFPKLAFLSSRRFSTCHLLPERLSAANSVVTHGAALLSSFLPSFPFLSSPPTNEDTFRTKVRASSLRLPLSILLPCERSRARARTHASFVEI